ncbi:hypothetical protein [Tardiphaga sp.]|jgi:hypothetical protein|uniref:hypothetical protein n=1 Tax=Tardiphaga sp. TaxID=1926292 RepID=UPI0037DA238B
MKKQSIDDAAQLFRDGDPPSVKKMISELIRQGNFVHRKSAYHIKCGECNFYLPRGTITKDPDVKMDERGPEAFLRIVPMTLLIDSDD